MIITVRRTLVAAAIATAAIGLASIPALADSPGPEHDPVTADVDGDRVPDTVPLQRSAPGTLLLRVAFTDETREATVRTGFDGDTTTPVVVDPADMDGDGRAELVMTTYVGANTATSQVWRFDDERGLHAVTDESGAPWELQEGGGIASVVGYACTTSDGRRMPYVVETVWDESRPGEEPIRYDGQMVAYELRDGVARTAATEHLEDLARDDPRLQPDRATCAP